MFGGAASLLGTIASAFSISQTQSTLEFFLSGSMAKVITLLTIVAPPQLQETLADIVFAETTTIGLRYKDMNRECLPREIVTLEIPLPLTPYPIKVRAIVRYRQGLRYGFEFLTLNDNQRDTIKRVCDYLATKA